jgi:PAS domain S-box-containing protein
MSTPTASPTPPAKLRLDAEARLREGSAPATCGWPTGIGALSLLHHLASDPGSADDALKLLHELQVHQVELDLQHEHMEATQRELAEDLANYRAFHDYAPVACLRLDAEGLVLDGNAAAARLFGLAREEWRGRLVETLFAPESRPALAGLLRRLGSGSSADGCETISGAKSRVGLLRLTASAAPGGGVFVAAMSDEDTPGT